MIFNSMKFFSEALGMCTEAYVLIPQRGTTGRIGDNEIRRQGIKATLNTLDGSVKRLQVDRNIHPVHDTPPFIGCSFGFSAPPGSVNGLSFDIIIAEKPP